MNTDNQRFADSVSPAEDTESAKMSPRCDGGVFDLSPGSSRARERPVDRFLAGAGTLHPLLSLLTAMAILGVGQAGFAFVFTALVGGHPDAQTSTILLLASFAGVWLALWAWMRFVEQRPMNCLGFRGHSNDVWIGVAIAVAILVIDVVVMTTSGQVTMLWARPSAMAVVLIVAAILLFLVQGCAEEVVLRGYIMQSVAAKWGIPAGLAIQAVVFAALHGANPGTTWVALVNVAGFGLMLGLLVVWRGNLLVAMGFHTVWNWLQGMVLGFDVSGLEFNQSVLTTVRTTGSHPWLTGGTFGAEGSIISTIVLVILVTGLLVTIRHEWRNN
ncbi:hypothetical protein PH30N_04962 [Cutibacterium modestum 30N]|nr:CAAX amino terminal protease family protein [Cutibacterium modestum P08]MCP2375669.1 hypothetical protein [Cutibacterium modestum 28N]MCP2380371.1 hypothetical protein [Cutibacterium modestum 30N]